MALISGVEDGEDRDLGADGGRVDGRHDGGLAQVLGAQRGSDRLGLRYLPHRSSKAALARVS
jgi:hypothetical protein